MENGIFSGIYNINSDGRHIGYLKDKSFSQIATGEINGKQYIFRTKGFINQNTEIINCAENIVVGDINYNTWKTSATISINNKITHWKCDNIWNTKWSMFNSDGLFIKFSGSSSKGQIESEVNDELLVLTGLFVINYYWQAMIVVLVAVFIPVLLTLM